MLKPGKSYTVPTIFRLLSSAETTKFTKYFSSINQRCALNWIRTITNFFGFGLDPAARPVNRFKKLSSGLDLYGVTVMENNCGVFVVEAVFCLFYELHLHYKFTLKKNLDYVWTWTEF